ncbi:probable 28S ribosomal protein S25, mitochondrial [Harmonia axyridis]|uniref:probable 28S ribosomal protein S25, mitochondrial n=1 Tax=Harmonia axyridis TaxID=115357 RepID=UPI001E276CDE|nr:probable 28S ribosomal protein S25, mitochondrial [Harmonia axyridis]
MPFMKGRAPVRRTLQYLEAGRLVLKDQIKIMTINYGLNSKNNGGTKDFVFWHLPQVQYKNPDVQIVTLKNMAPSPFVRVFYETGHQMLIDLDCRSKDEIYEHLIRVIGKSEKVLEKETIAREKKDNPANFGELCDRHCICEIPGQVPCPGTCPLPQHWRGKYKYNKIVE